MHMLISKKAIVYRRFAPGTLCTTNSSSLGARRRIGLKTPRAGALARARRCSDAAGALATRRHDVIDTTGLVYSLIAAPPS